MVNMAELGKLPTDLGGYTEQPELAEFGDRIAGYLQDMGTRDMEKDGRKYRIMVYRVKISSRIPNEYVDEVHDITHNWAKRDDENGNAIIAPYSQARLALYLMQTKLGTTELSKMVGQHIEFERHSISELPDFKPERFANLSDEQPRLYPVRIIKS